MRAALTFSSLSSIDTIGQLIKSTLAGTTFAFTFMEVLDTTVANVALAYIAGGMGVSVRMRRLRW